MAVLDLSQIAPEAPRPITRDEYERLVSMGFFDEGEHVELLYGVLVRMTPQNPPHSSVVEELTETFVSKLIGRARVRIQLPFAASDDSEPEPDVAVVPLGDYTSKHPREALLIVEVAHTSHRKDRNVKARLYAESGVPEYWLVDVPARAVEVYTGPRDGRYESVVTCSSDDHIVLVHFPDVSLAVDDVF